MSVDFPRQLVGRLWHTTHPDRYDQIVEQGSILAEPDLPDCGRWSTNAGPEWYPYVRTLGGVSLFDFAGFEPDTYDENYPQSNWREFVPFRRSWGAAIWIEINEEAVPDELIRGPALLKRWKSDRVGNRIMPLIEAAHLGAIPSVAFAAVFLSDSEGFRLLRS